MNASLTPYQSDNITAPHGFFTRQGGVSTGLYDSLNTGLGSQDSQDNVLENHRRVAGFFNRPIGALQTLRQIHSATCVTIDAPYTIDSRPEADALATATSGIILGILTADCVPVLLHDPHARVIGAAHAGWKGAFAGVVQNTVAAMQALGAQTSQIQATIGPAIEQKSYEVDAAFRQQFVEQNSNLSSLFVPSKQRLSSHYQFDLKGFVALQCTSLSIDVNIMPHDTYSSDEFFSFRQTTHANKPDYGRHISAIML